MTPALSIITTCKGRLDHLMQSLPRMAAQIGCECIVVDCGCPDRAGEWVKRHFPIVKLATTGPAATYRATHARNIGAREARSEWLAFIDADLLLEPEFAVELGRILRRKSFLSISLQRDGARGIVACHRGDYFAIEGHDEVLEGYGGEERDLCLRLEHAGCRMVQSAGNLVKALPHDDARRTAFHEIHDIELSRRINALYLHIKHDLIHESGKLNLPFEVRRAVYAEVRRILLDSERSGAGAAVITIDLPTELRFPLTAGWAIRRKWVFEMGQFADARMPSP